MPNRPAEEKHPIIYLHENTYGKRCWTIRTINEEYPRYIEVISQWNKKVDYALVPNIHYAKVWCSISPPYRAIEKFEKATGIKACFQEVPAEAYEHYKSYEAYFNGQRELTEEEEKQLELEREQWKQEILPVEDYKEITLKGKRRKGTFEIN